MMKRNLLKILLFLPLILSCQLLLMGRPSFSELEIKALHGELILATDHSITHLSGNGITSSDFFIAPAQTVWLESPYLSPDYRYIALWLVNRDNENTVFLYDLENTQTQEFPISRQTLGGWYDDSHILISPIPPEIFPTRLLNIETIEQTILLDWDELIVPAPDASLSTSNYYWRDWHEELSPNRDYVFYRSSEGLVLADVDSDRVVWEFPVERTAFPHYPQWRPNSDVVVYTKSELLESSSQEAILDNDLYAVNTLGDHQLLYDGWVDGQSLTWSSDGTYLAFFSRDVSTNVATLHVIEYLEQNFTMIYEEDVEINPLDLTWLSDGHIVYQYDDALYFVDLTQHETQFVDLNLENFRIAGYIPSE